MALRNNNEQSYRTLAMTTLQTIIVAMANEAIGGLSEKQLLDSSNEVRSKLLCDSLAIADMKLASDWLAELDEKLCPEVAPLEQQALDRIKKGEDMHKVVGDAVAFIEKLTVKIRS